MLLCTFLVLLSSTPSEAIDFARDVQPILASNCYLCHGPDPSSREAGLRLDLRSEALASAIVAGRADQSELIQRITAHDEDRMPPDDRPALSHDEIEVLRNWIDQGANWSEHWCWRPLADPHPPNMQQAWCRDPIDGFVLSRLESVGLEPAPEADRATLLRRLNYDLVGLPPTAEELAPLNHSRTAYCVLAERAVNRHLQGGCQVPIACFAELNAEGTGLYMRGLVGSVDGRTILRADIEGQVQYAEQLGVQLAEQLLAQGARDILAEVYGS